MIRPNRVKPVAVGQNWGLYPRGGARGGCGVHRVLLHAALPAVPVLIVPMWQSAPGLVALPQVSGADGDVLELPWANHVRGFAMGTVRLMVLMRSASGDLPGSLHSVPSDVHTYGTFTL